MPSKKKNKNKKKNTAGAPAGTQNVASGSTSGILKSVTPARKASIAQRLAESLKIDHGIVYVQGLRPEWRKQNYERSVAVFLPAEAWEEDRVPGDQEKNTITALIAAGKRLNRVLTAVSRFRFQDLQDPKGRIWYLDEELGRHIESIYSGWTARFDKELQRIPEERLAIANELEASGANVSTLQEIEKIAGNLNNLSNKLKATEAENHRLSHTIISNSSYEHPLCKETGLTSEEIFQKITATNITLQLQVENRDTVVRRTEQESLRYMGDIRLRMLLQHWGVPERRDGQSVGWQKYDPDNRAAMRVDEELERVLTGVPKSIGNIVMQCPEPISLKGLARVSNIHRIVHGADLIADCRMIALRLIYIRQDKGWDNTVGLLPKHLESQGCGGSFYQPPAGTVFPSPEPESDDDDMDLDDEPENHTDKMDVDNEPKNHDDKMDLDDKPKINDDKKDSDEKLPFSPWQNLFDHTFTQLYGLTQNDAEHILVALMPLKMKEREFIYGPTKERLAARKKLWSHVDFINKWVSIHYGVHHYAKRASRSPVWRFWKPEWVKLRKVMTEQYFGVHKKKKAKDKDEELEPIVRPIFLDYVRLFAQACRLFNFPESQPASEWASELERLDKERWDVYRFAIQTWNHGDLEGGRSEDQYDGRGVPKSPVKGNMWTDLNVMYNADDWKFGLRHDPKRPPKAPELFAPLPTLRATADHKPFGLTSYDWVTYKEQQPEDWDKYVGLQFWALN